MRRRPQKPKTLTVGELLMQVGRLMADRMRVRMEKIGLHMAQGFALFCLRNCEGAAQSEIALASHLSAASVTSMLQRMERDGWVVRERDPDDRRVLRVYLSDKSRELYDEAEASFQEMERGILRVLRPDEQEKLHELLSKLHAGLIECVSAGSADERGEDE